MNQSPGRVLLLGSTGQVGTELRRVFADRNILALDRKSADLSRPQSLRDIVREARPALILNAAAYTAVDRAEIEPELADAVNHRAVQVLAEEAETLGAVLVHYSTDYVFDGSKDAPWVESDQPAPLNVYGQSKLAGEGAIAASCQRYLVLRTSWVYGPHGQNFLKTMLRLGREREVLSVVDDQIGAPTSSAALAEATREILDRHRLEDRLEHGGASPSQWAGVYHATCSGQTSWCGFAQAIFAAAARRQPDGWPRVEGIASRDYSTPAKRPAYSVLDGSRLRERFGVQLPAWQAALDDLMDKTLPR